MSNFPFKGKFVGNVWLRNKTRWAILALRKLGKDKNLTASEKLHAIDLYMELVRMGPTPSPFDQKVTVASKDLREKVLALVEKAASKEAKPPSLQ